MSNRRAPALYKVRQVQPVATAPGSVLVEPLWLLSLKQVSPVARTPQRTVGFPDRFGFLL